MNDMAVVNARVDAKTKSAATQILKSLGLNVSEAINLFFKQVIYTRSIPFELRLPNKETVATFHRTDAGEDLHRAAGIDELKEELDL
jgi:DNA-damage-inducible protein J